MRLSLPVEARRVIVEHAERSYPEECCGSLLGRDDGEVRTVLEALPFGNSVAENRARRFLIDPRALLEAERLARGRGLDVVGIYHSHPDHPSRPSDFDREHALPFWSYVIVAVAAGVAGELSSWQLREDRTRFDPEPL